MTVEKAIEKYEFAKDDLKRVAKMFDSHFMDVSVREDRLRNAKKTLIKCLGGREFSKLYKGKKDNEAN